MTQQKINLSTRLCVALRYISSPFSQANLSQKALKYIAKNITRQKWTYIIHKMEHEYSVLYWYTIKWKGQSKKQEKKRKKCNAQFYISHTEQH